MVDMLQVRQRLKIGRRLSRREIRAKPRYPSRAYSMLRRRVKGLGSWMMGGGPLNERTGGRGGQILIGTMDRRQRGHGMWEAHSVLGLDSTMLG